MLSSKIDENGELSFGKLFNNILEESMAYKYYKKLKETVEKNTLKSVFISAALNIQPMGSEQIQKIITDDTLDLKSIRREKTALFIVLPSSDNSFQCLLTTLLIQMIYVGNDKRKRGMDAGILHVGRVRKYWQNPRD